MAKDSRLYAKVTLEFTRHRKIAILSDAAFRALLEMILYSREEQTDGLLASRYAVARWSLEILQELCTNDDANPSLSECDKGWYIHDFKQHQDTRADIDARRERNKLNGQQGGAAKHKRVAKRVAKRAPNQAASGSDTENLAEIHSVVTKGNGGNIPPEVTKHPPKGQSLRKSGTSPDAPVDRMGRPSMSVTRLAGNEEHSPPPPPKDPQPEAVAAYKAGDLVSANVTKGRWSDAILADLRHQVSVFVNLGYSDEKLALMIRSWDNEPSGGRRQLRYFELDAERELNQSNGNGRPNGNGRRVATSDRIVSEIDALRDKPRTRSSPLYMKELTNGS